MTAKKRIITPDSVTFPHDWKCATYQQGLWDYMMADNSQKKRGVAVCHRRWGKDSVGINFTATRAMMDPGVYYYMAPTQKHARKIIWTNIGRDGRKVIDQAFPKSIRKTTNDQEMYIETINGSTFQLVGSDNYDGIVGSNPKGVVFSEWAIATKPESWDFFRPILRENGGWAMFIYTPRGMNHGYKTYNMAMNNPAWYCELQTINDSGVMTDADVQEEIDAGMSLTKARQEFYCEFSRDTERQLFSTELALAAQKRDVPRLDGGAPMICGVDVARFGDDASVIATRIGRDFKSIPLTVLRGKTDIFQVAEAVQAHHNKYQPDAIFVDSTGVGGGVCDALRQMRVPHFAINFQNSAKDKDKYANIRAEMYARFAEWFDDPEVAYHDDQALLEQLTCIQYDEEYDPHGRAKLESKAKIKKNTGVSPDETDAGALTFAKTVLRKDLQRNRGRRGPRKALML